MSGEPSRSVSLIHLTRLSCTSNTNPLTHLPFEDAGKKSMHAMQQSRQTSQRRCRRSSAASARDPGRSSGLRLPSPSAVGPTGQFSHAAKIIGPKRKSGKGGCGGKKTAFLCCIYKQPSRKRSLVASLPPPPTVPSLAAAPTTLLTHTKRRPGTRTEGGIL
jgi:hypothetical protein